MNKAALDYIQRLGWSVFSLQSVDEIILRGPYRLLLPAIQQYVN